MPATPSWRCAEVEIACTSGKSSCTSTFQWCSTLRHIYSSIHASFLWLRSHIWVIQAAFFFKNLYSTSGVSTAVNWLLCFEWALSLSYHHQLQQQSVKLMDSLLFYLIVWINRAKFLPFICKMNRRGKSFYSSDLSLISFPKTKVPLLAIRKDQYAFIFVLK